MTRNTPIIIVLLTGTWVILVENLSITSVAIGVTVSIGSVYTCHRLLPLTNAIKDINFFRFATYPFYLLGQIYLSAFNAMKLIFTGADVTIVDVKTKIANQYLRAILANSFTLTPGTVSLELKDDTVSLLWLKGKKETQQDVEKAGELTTAKLERILLKAEK